jgi:D-Tyr-tRNAtyr deacylase
MKFIVVLITAVLLSINASAAEGKKESKTTKSNNTEVAYSSIQTVDVKGSVIDGKSRESLAGAAIFIDGTKYYSDLEGNFAISNLKPVQKGIFGADMKVSLINDGPVTIIIDTKNRE